MGRGCAFPAAIQELGSQPRDAGRSTTRNANATAVVPSNLLAQLHRASSRVIGTTRFGGDQDRSGRGDINESGRWGEAAARPVKRHRVGSGHPAWRSGHGVISFVSKGEDGAFIGASRAGDVRGRVFCSAGNTQAS